MNENHIYMLSFDNGDIALRYNSKTGLLEINMDEENLKGLLARVGNTLSEGINIDLPLPNGKLKTFYNVKQIESIGDEDSEIRLYCTNRKEKRKILSDYPVDHPHKWN